MNEKKKPEERKRKNKTEIGNKGKDIGNERKGNKKIKEKK